MSKIELKKYEKCSISHDRPKIKKVIFGQKKHRMQNDFFIKKIISSKNTSKIKQT